MINKCGVCGMVKIISYIKNKVRLRESEVWGEKKQFTIWNRRLRVSVVEKIKYGQRLKQVREVIPDQAMCIPDGEKSKFSGPRMLLCVAGVKDSRKPLQVRRSWGKGGILVLKTEVTGSTSWRPRNLAFILSEMISHWKCLKRSVASSGK